MKKFALLLATASVLLGCEELQTVDRNKTDNEIEGWRAKTILGGGDNSAYARNQGRVTSASQVAAGDGTIFPGRVPLLRDSDFVNENGERTVSLNLVNVDIETAAAAILGELLKENYVIDPGVEGVVNIRSSQPITRTTAIEVFELGLKQNNAALIRRGDIFAIVPLSGDLSLGVTTARDVLPGYTIRVVPLQNIGAQEMAAILQPFAGNGIVGIDAQRNIIVLAGTSADQKSWQKTITSFDVNWLANRSVGIFPIKGRSAQSIVRGLERVVETDDNFEPITVFEVIPENNSILAVAKTPNALANVSVWIKRLTQEGQNDAQVYSYDMKYARASDIGPTLSQILGVSVESAGSDENAEAEILEASAEFGNTQGTLNATRIVASEATNTLLIHATPDEYERVLGILHRLDVPQRQVLVEATIVEVSLTNDLRYGVQYFFEDSGDSIGLSRLDSASPIAPDLPGFSLSLGGATPDVVIDALDDVTSINVISSPNLMILNNESARLVVGDQVPTSVRTSQDADNDSDVFISTVEYRDTGVIFEVTPRINSSGSVILNIGQEVSSVGETDADTGNPIISQRTVNSSVAVDSGETIVLGGLFSKEGSRGNSGIPVLKDIPVAGKLFGRTSRSNRQTELLVLITPRIVNNRMDARRVTSQLRSRVESLRLDDASLSTTINVPSTRTENSRRFNEDSVSRNSTSQEPVAVAAAKPETSTRNANVATAAVAAVTQQPIAAGSHFAVLGSFKSQADATKHWSKILRTDGAVLKTVSPSYLTSGDMTLVSVGPLSPADARQLCIDVRTDCYISKK
ncbi:type II secretion system secretin GspD [Litoreibacter roseus]|uniref:Uncharacterized protein n=1 Tax=Litoreibacter roseus TaxID=2601869 RepID=A0A6N6JKN0_9RHOB|nr:type II secretion system secretin GspD [Litoreibacter roseus]GFE66497.1 hypothetical protein KIN_35710 [Litoreibacter roseus]